MRIQDPAISVFINVDLSSKAVGIQIFKSPLPGIVNLQIHQKLSTAHKKWLRA